MVTRNVVLICGPPGAGKTTHAHTLGLPVYDLDDPRWRNSDRAFTAALARLGRTRDAQAAVIRTGTTRSARTAAAALVRATEVCIIDTDPDTCIARVTARNRRRPFSVTQQVATIRAWHAQYAADALHSEDARG